MAKGIAPEPPGQDCFALPPGVDWIPVDAALARLRGLLVPVTASEDIAASEATGRVLARDVAARRDHPPAADAAVDGYGFADGATGPLRLPLVKGRAAAGQPFAGHVPAGHAVRILTGAILPAGVDTVVMQEACTSDGTTVGFAGPVARGSNTRPAGEDLRAGAPILAAGRVITPGDVALLAAAGVGAVQVRRVLRVAVLSTGDEVVDAPAAPTADLAPAHQTYDANRPMLLAMARGWGAVAIDLGRIADDAPAIAAALNRGAAQADVILTSGGASAGDEDHVSRILREQGTLSSWRIAMKPGRPLALATWKGVPVLGLPGNPVAAFVCALIFARPALGALAGAGWTEPAAFDVPAAFTKRKKAGRREYLRARINAAGQAEVFASEGSGRVSGLSWATGLVELPDAALVVEPGDRVRYLPFSGFGL